MSSNPRVQSLGEGGVLLRWPGGAEASARAPEVAAAWRAVKAMAGDAMLDVVPAPASLLVRFDPRRQSRRQVETAVVRAIAAARPIPGAAGMHQVRVRYGGAAGPDLEDAAAALGLAPAQLVEIHAGATYTVTSTGFAPGFVYMGPLPKRLVLPRRAEPRLRVPAGSVAIAERQTGIYGVGSAGGWWLIGRTKEHTFDPTKLPPTDFVIGDRVRFTRER